MLGLGPLEPLLKDPTITDILVNTHEQVFVERHGQLELTPVRFKDEQHLLRIIEQDRLRGRAGGSTSRSPGWMPAWPTARASTPSSRRCALDGPLLSIRKFARVPLTIERLIEIGTITQAMAEVLQRRRRRRASTS